jgi:SAM-dependent methyltransferase
VLDAGCGSGRLTASLGRCGARSVVGLDISESVEVAARRVESLPNVRILQGDILNPPLRPGSFDLVWSEGVLHHTPDAAAAFRSLARRVRPGGRMYVWLYPPGFNAYRFVRDLLPFAWRLPGRLLVLLCRVLAAPLWLAARIRGWRRPGGSRGYREVVFGLHDNLSPRWQSRHAVDELVSWYHAAGFVEIRPVGPATGVLGCAPAAPPAPAPPA